MSEDDQYVSILSFGGIVRAVSVEDNFENAALGMISYCETMTGEFDPRGDDGRIFKDSPGGGVGDEIFSIDPDKHLPDEFDIGDNVMVFNEKTDGPDLLLAEVTGRSDGGGYTVEFNEGYPDDTIPDDNLVFRDEIMMDATSLEDPSQEQSSGMGM